MVSATVAAACRGNSPRETAGSAAGSAAAKVARVEREKPRALPHEGAISLVAMTERATAAVTIDGTGGARLWPTLDGTREPVAFGVASAPAAIALAETSDGFAAAIVDEAGGMQIVQLDRDGRRLGAATLPPEPGIKQVSARRDGFLLRTRDERIAWIDARGKELGAVVPQPGEQMLQLVARDENAFVAFGDETETAATVRFLAFDHGLAWGPPITLPNHLRLPLALAPTVQRIAGVSFSNTGVDMIDLTASTTAHVDLTGAIECAGFVGNGTLVMAVDHVATWWVEGTDRWYPPSTTRELGTTTQCAIGNDFAVSPNGSSLALLEASRTRYLGYGQLGPGLVWPMGTGYAIRGARARWFDRMLRQTLVDPDVEAVLPVDETHAVRSAATGTFLVDLARHAEIKLDDANLNATDAAFTPATGVLTVDEGDKIERWRIDLAKSTALRGQPLATGKHDQRFVLDPAASGYMAAVIDPVIEEGDEYFIVWWPPPETPHTPPARQKVNVQEVVIAADVAGNVYTTSTNIDLDPPLELVRYPPGGTPTKLKVPSHAFRAAVAPDGTDLAFQLSDDSMVLTSSDGAEKWRTPIRGTIAPAFSADGRTVFSYGAAGAMSFDRATGTMLATACAWDFGISTIPPDAQLTTTLETCAP